MTVRDAMVAEREGGKKDRSTLEVNVEELGYTKSIDCCQSSACQRIIISLKIKV